MSEQTNPSGTISLYTHTNRNDWGVAVLVREDGGKRGYLFEDGEERTMASGYHQLMRLVEKPSAGQIAFYERHTARLSRRQKASSSTPTGGGPSFLDQLDRLHSAYPDGLLDPKWVRDVRGEGAELRAPQHRSPLVREAQEQLTGPALEALIKSQSFTQALDLVTTVLSHSDLVPPAQLKKLKAAKSRDGLGAFVGALNELLYGKAAYDQRFDRFVNALAAVYGEEPHWEVATAVTAAVSPTEHVCVHPTSLRQQLKALGGRSTVPPRATSAGYTRFLSVARLISDKLKEQEQAPRDFFDVSDFIRLTAGPAPKTAATPAKKPAARRAAAETSSDSEADGDE